MNYDVVEVVNPMVLDAPVRALKDSVLVKNIERGVKKLKSGLILPDDNMRESGIRPRWAEVYSVGEKAKEKYGLEKGQWILISHGRWTRGIPVKTPEEEFYLHKVEIESILLVSDKKPEEFETARTFDGLQNKRA